MPGKSFNVWTPDSTADLSTTPQEPPPSYYSNGHAGPSEGSEPAPMGEEDVERQPVVLKEEADDDRGQWGSKMEFILSCVGLSVGLGNVWRFPHLCYENGGAAFVIAYFVLQLLIGKPMYFMELVMGQFSAKGPTKVWEMNPSAKGIGISMCIVSLIVAIYYNVIMAYTLFYFFSSMQKTLPWTECKEEWKTLYNCLETRPPSACESNSSSAICACTGDSILDPPNCTIVPDYFTTAAENFFYRDVIKISDGVYPGQMGKPLWKLALCLLLSWIVVVICLIKGIKSSGKVVYFTATFPYIILLILLVRGSLLDGAIDGVEFFIVPKWDKLTDISVWVTAAGQMFFSLSVSFGGIIMFGSYNKFRNQVYYDALLISVMDLLTSLIAGFVVFTTLGGLAHSVGSSVKDVAKKGYGLAFVVYPEALDSLEPSQLWSVLFFFMLFTLGLDSEFGFMETVLTCVQDEFPKMRKYKSVMIIVLGSACYLMALPCVCPGGDYVVSIMDHYGGDFAVLFLSCFEVISVMWVYGAMRFLKDIEYMLGSKPHGWPYWIFTWSVTSPVIIACLVTYRMINYEENNTFVEEYPDFAQIIGWALCGLALCPVPLWFLYRLSRSFMEPHVTNHTERLQYMFCPTKEWVPNDGLHRYLVPDGTPHGNSHPMVNKTGQENFAYTHDTKF